MVIAMRAAILFLFSFSFIYCDVIYSEENVDKAVSGLAQGKAEVREDKDKNDNKAGGDKDKKNEKKPLKIGNLALRASQQPGPLVGFGGNIIDKNQFQYFLFADESKGENKYNLETFPGVLYGISDNYSVFLNVPVALRFKDGPNRSSGLEDVFVQLEYAFYNKNELLYVEQATVVTNITFPTGSATKNPPTGFGAPSIFLAATFNHTAIDWFYYLAAGAILTGENNRTKIGNQYLYQGTLGRNITNWPGWILAWMVEIDGQYNERNIIKGVIDPNSGGNFIFLTPSLWLSSEHLVLQFGVGYAIQQNLLGDQRKNKWLYSFNLGWTF